jgi:hypothetical protein
MAEQKQIRLNLPADLQPMFSNMIRIGHTPAEFILDFFKLLPGMETVNVDTRIILTPLGAKMLLRVLSENIQHYEATFGEIRMPSPPHTLADDLFNLGGPAPTDGK